MTNRFIQKGWAPKQPLDYFLQVGIRGAMFSISGSLSSLWKEHRALECGWSDSSAAFDGWVASGVITRIA